MAYNFDEIPNRRNPNLLNKWTKYSKDVLPMWIADMDFQSPQPIRDALQKALDHGVLGYELPSKKLLETVAERMHRLYDWKISEEMIVSLTGVNIGYNVAARTFCTPHKGYLIQTPVYNEFHETEKKTGMLEIESPLVKLVDGNRIKYEVNFDVFGKAAKKASIFLLCHPHNPIGHIYSREELKCIAEICIENDLIIVSDEIHSELLLGGTTFQPMATLSREIANRTITLISASKTFNVPGLFSAFAIIPNKKLRERYKETVFKMGIHVSSPGLFAARVAYSGKCDSWLRDLRRYLTDNRDWLADAVTQYMPEVRVTVPDATYLAWLDFSALKLKPSPFQFFLTEAKVALSDGGKFGKGSEQFVRLNFGTSHKWLVEGFERMRKAIK
jgi:cysteine-S-conjugate beta-lyase